PFDHPLLWEGHASLVDEMLEAGPAPDAVVVAVGGGGLLCGVAEGLARHGLNMVPIVAVETQGAASFAAAMDAGRPVALDRIDTIASSLGARQVCGEAFQWSRRRSPTPTPCAPAHVSPTSTWRWSSPPAARPSASPTTTIRRWPPSAAWR